MSRILDRRKFLQACTGVAGASVLARYRAMAAPETGRTKIRDIKVMVIGTARLSWMGESRFPRDTPMVISPPACWISGPCPRRSDYRSAFRSAAESD